VARRHLAGLQAVGGSTFIGCSHSVRADGGSVPVVSVLFPGALFV